ncbi:MAG: GNAT family N-acetyltransferase [Vicinamibacterales bacterium]|nr:GNAT family N-acetyltransferase [Vicinamibacterales bacterium]
MFCAAELAARIERAEAQLSADIGAAACARGAVPPAFVEEIGGGFAVFAGAGAPVNKLIGAGFSGPPEDDRLGQIEALFAGCGSHVQAEIATLADPAWHAVFGPRGYVLAGFENVLGMALPASRERTPDAGISIVECGPADGPLWLDTVVTGFACPDDVPAQAAGQEFPREAIERVFEDFAAAPGFRRYLAYVGHDVAGGGSLREWAGVAQLCGAATLPGFRRRGVQSALLDARLRDASRRGCNLAVVTTAPGSTSMQNAQRRGFALLYARALHIKAG